MPRAQQTWHSPKTWLAALAIFALTIGIFAPAIRNGFVNYDDDVYVYANPAVNRGITSTGILEAFTEPHARNWHPLTTISHMIDCQLFGLDPAGHHIVNVLLHALAASILFFALQLMTTNSSRAFVVALLFAFHPLRVESVAWIAERKDVLSAFFFALTLWAYARYARLGNWRRMGVVICCYAAGLMAKPMLVTTPIVLLLLDFWPLQRLGARTHKERSAGTVSFRNAVVEKIPLLLLSFASCCATFAAAQRGDIPAAMPLMERLANAALSYCVYIRQLFWPHDLAVFYPLPIREPAVGVVAGAALVILTVSIAAIMLRRRWPFFLTGWFWYFIMVLPVSGIVQIGLQAHADRYTYLPQIGLLITTTWAIAALVQRAALPAAAPVAAAVATALLGWVSWRELRWWRTSELLWQRAISVTSDNDVAFNNLGAAYEADGQLDLAMQKYREALRILGKRPAEPYALSRALVHNNIGNLLLRRDDFSQAMNEYRQSIALRPDFANAHLNLGEAYAKQGKWDAAFSEYETATRLHPRDADAQHRSGIALMRLGRVDEAIARYRAALEADPANASAEVDLGNALLEKRDPEQAVLHYRNAEETDPRNANAPFNLGSIYLQQHRVLDAINQYQRLTQLQPQDPEAHLSLGNAFAAGSQEKRAASEMEKALELAPDSISALNNLAWLLASSSDPAVRNPSRAVSLAEKAVELARQPNALIYHTLAAAYAAAGRKSEAVTAAENSHQLAVDQGDTALAKAVQRELDAYRAPPKSP